MVAMRPYALDGITTLHIRRRQPLARSRSLAARVSSQFESFLGTQAGLELPISPEMFASTSCH